MNLQSTHQLLTVLASLVGGGAGIVLFAKATKKYAKLESGILHTLVVALSVAAAVLQYVYQLHASLPPAILGVSISAFYGYSQLLYKYAFYVKKTAGQFQLVNKNDTATTDSTVTGTTTTSTVNVSATTPTSGAEPTF